MKRVCVCGCLRLNVYLYLLVVVPVAVLSVIVLWASIPQQFRHVFDKLVISNLSRIIAYITSMKSFER